MEKEIKLIGILTLIFAITGSVIIAFFNLWGALFFLLGSVIILAHYKGIKGISSIVARKEKRKKATVLSIVLFILTLGAVLFVVFYLVSRNFPMVIYFLSGVLTLALSANIVIIELLIGRRNGRGKTLDS